MSMDKVQIGTKLTITNPETKKKRKGEVVSFDGYTMVVKFTDGAVENFYYTPEKTH